MADSESPPPMTASEHTELLPMNPDALVHDYVENYEFRGDADYTPNEAECTLIEDAIHGFLSVLEGAGLLAKPAPDGAEPVPVAWPDERVCLPDPERPGARIVGFRIREGDEAWGVLGLSEPLAWLERAIHSASAVSGEPMAWMRVEKEIHPEYPKRVDTTTDPELAAMWRAHEYTESLIPLFASPTGMGVTEEMVERAARALAADELGMGDPPAVVASIVDHQWRAFANQARVALTAALHPTSETTK